MKRSKLKLAQGTSVPWTVVEFGSSLDRARGLEKEILDCCQKHRYGEADIFAIKLALEEALVNAVKHGNKLDPAKVVKVQYHVTEQRADITIEDQGPGFNPAGLPNPTDDENLEKCSGRGILLMRAYMSSVVFNPSGNKVTLTKFNEGFTASGNTAMA
jgi:serine/threonine-protein kinase RsbW